MELYLDTANVAEVERLARIYPLAGVTTNPSIIAAGKSPGLGCAAAPAKSRRSGGHPLGADHEPRRAGHGGSQTSEQCRAGPCGQIPVTAEGLAAIKLLKKEGIPTLGTAVYSAYARPAGRAGTAQSTSRLTLTASTPRAGTASAWCRSCNPCWKCMRPRAKFWRQASKRHARRWIVCWLAANRRFPTVRELIQ